MDIADWLKTWLIRHPLKAPSDTDRGGFTAQVMARVRADAQPRRAHPAWTVRLQELWPQAAVSLAVAAAMLIGVTLVRPLVSGGRLAVQLAQESELLARLDEPVSDGLAPDDVDDLAGELEREDLMVLAEAPPSDDSWVAETLHLLNQLDEELPEEPSAGDSNSNGNEWLEELQMLDESELAARS